MLDAEALRSPEFLLSVLIVFQISIVVYLPCSPSRISRALLVQLCFHAQAKTSRRQRCYRNL